jgi:hypothetical protein
VHVGRVPYQMITGAFVGFVGEFEAASKRNYMSQRSKEIMIYILGAVVIAGVVVFFQYHQFHWWLLLIPVFGAPIKIIYARRQKHWDDLQSRRQ